MDALPLSAPALDVHGVEWTDAAQRELEKAERFDTVRGLDTVAAMRARSAPLFCVSHRGATVGFYVVELVQHPNGIEAVVSAASGSCPGANLTAVMSHAVQLQAAGVADHVTAYTRRPGLVRKLVRLGWSADCVVLRKSLKCH